MESIARPADLVRVIRGLNDSTRFGLGALPQMAPLTPVDGVMVFASADVDPSAADILADWLRELLPGMDLIRALAYTICALAVLPKALLMAPVAALTPLLATQFKRARSEPQQ